MHLPALCAPRLLPAGPELVDTGPDVVLGDALDDGGVVGCADDEWVDAGVDEGWVDAGMADGGIMNTDIVGGMMDGNMDEMGRQMYGLGKLVKTATRAIKKVAKSPLGKAALVAAGGYALGGGTFFGKSLPFLKAKGGFSLANLGTNLGLGAFENVGSNRIFQKNALGKFLTSPAGLIAASSALPFLFQGQEDEEEFDPYRGPEI